LQRLSVTPKVRFQGHGVTTNVLGVLCAQLTRDLFAIAMFLVISVACLVYETAYR